MYDDGGGESSTKNRERKEWREEFVDDNDEMTINDHQGKEYKK
jgi:hypothetical protein